MSKPLVRLSIICPAYNLGPRIDAYSACLKALAAELDAVELVVVNDGSTDMSKALLETRLGDVTNVHLVNKINGGLSSARNHGLRFAQGRYVAYLDDDDALDAQALAGALSYCERWRLDMLRIGVEERTDRRVDYHRVATTDTLPGPLWLLRSVADNQDYYTPAWAYLYSRALLRRAGGFIEGIYHEDCEFVPRLLGMARRCGGLDMPVYYYVRRKGSITADISEQRMAKRLRDLRTVVRRLSRLVGGRQNANYQRALLMIIVDLMTYQRTLARQSGRPGLTLFAALTYFGGAAELCLRSITRPAAWRLSLQGLWLGTKSFADVVRGVAHR